MLKAETGSALFRVLLVFLFTGLVTVVTYMLYRGGPYYVLPLEERYLSPLHRDFKPGGDIGHPLGIAGSCMLVGLLVYSLRKRVRFMRNWGRLSHWLQFHIFLGFAGPLLITLHASFKLRGIVAISYWSMMLVFLSGIFGRYLYAQIPRAISGKELELQDLTKQTEEINSQLAALLKPEDLKKVQDLTNFTPGPPRSAFRTLWLIVADDFAWWKQKADMKKILKRSGDLKAEERSKLIGLARQRRLQLRRISLMKASQSIFRHWHVIHLPLAQTMYITMLIHIVVVVMTGYF